jgi:hypothetical protein
LKTDPRKALGWLWQLLTAVPGWPDAPSSLRLRRALPIALPCLGLLLLAGWELAIEQPRARADRALRAPLITAEAEVTALRMKWSDAAAASLTVRARQSERALLPRPEAIPEALAALSAAAAAQHWQASFRTAATESTDAPPGSPIGYLLARGRLAPDPENDRPFPTLLAFLETFETNEKAIDLTRLSICADEDGRYSVEASLRLAYRLAP